MGLHRLRQGGLVVASFQTADQSAAGMGPGHLQNLARHGGEIFRFQSQGTDGILDMGVETGAEQHQFRLTFRRRRFQSLRELGQVGADAACPALPAR